MANRPVPYWPIVSVIVGVLIVVVALPAKYKEGWAPSFLNPGFHLGLDLAGGTQLDFRISENEIDEQLRGIDAQIEELKAQGLAGDKLTQMQNDRTIVEKQKANLVEAIRTVLERRINSLGVSEATITPSYVGNEKHLLVECPGVVDVQKCIATVGKTIQLEFKEEFTEATKEYEDGIRAKVAATQKRMAGSGVSLAVIGEDMGTDLGVAFTPSRWFYKDQLPAGLESLWDKKPANGVIRLDATVKVPVKNDKGETVEQDVKGIFLTEVLSPRTMTGRTIQEAPVAFGVLAKEIPNTTQKLDENLALDTSLAGPLTSALKSMKQGDLKVVAMPDKTAKLLFLRSYTPGTKKVDVSHILVAYSGASAVPQGVTRSKADALKKAQDLKTQLNGGANFENLARTQSDGPSAANAGKLVGVGMGDVVPSFETVAFSQAVGKISDPVETPFGYHLIRVDKAPYQTPDKASFDSLTFTGDNSEQLANQALELLQQGKVTRQEEALQLRTLFFSLLPTGWKDTSLDGKHFRSAAFYLDPTTNLPIVQIVFDAEGGKIFQELTKRNIGKRIAIFVGGEMVSSPTVQGEIIGGTAVITGSKTIEEAQMLAQDLNTGAIPAPIYLSGQRTVEASLGSEALRTSVLAGFFGMLVVMLYMFIVYRALGLIANIALVIYAVIFLAILKLPLFLFTDQYIVLTLAGAAGMILSIGMAVDTNVLVYERIKEELRKGKMLRTAVDIGFDKAWPSIRDSNISTIITCVLLFIIGTSIVRGFAVTLGMGVIISMFTGMIISRWITGKLAESKFANNPALFPGMKKEESTNYENTSN